MQMKALEIWQERASSLRFVDDAVEERRVAVLMR